MIPIMMLSVFISIALSVAVFLLYKILCISKDNWIFYDTMRGEYEDTNRKLDEMLAFMKLTFNKDFAKKVEDVIRIKENIPTTVKIRCDDGLEHELPVDHGF